ncbi:YqgE/AlgH family protein [Algicola sagamiensis]|uniref:YqgE/AlgH family protein n=1 Tax=Algicola sagamiensis TaxID=163869 RepID=UPI00036CA65F|nr:YqgE/AlgH family protein [Algicola sagamiensis]
MQNLQDHFLIAMPALRDSYFERSVTYICEHSEEGAMGLVINQPISLTIRELLTQIEIDSTDEFSQEENSVFAGGPVQNDRGFVLHSPGGTWNSSMQLTKDVSITTSKDILEAIGNNLAPEKFLVTLGYAGWSEGQLEQELIDNTWLTIPADEEILFDVPIHLRWQKAAEKIGIDVWQLSSQIGHA